MPGLIPSVTQARTTKYPISVSTRMRSPVRTPPFSVAVRAGNWHDIRRSRFGRAREHAAKVTFANIFEFFSGDRLLMNRANLLCDFERAISAHEFEWP